MERQSGNVGNFIFQHNEADKDENSNKDPKMVESDEEKLVTVDDSIDFNDDKVRMLSSAKLARAPLNYSQASVMIEITSTMLISGQIYKWLMIKLIDLISIITGLRRISTPWPRRRSSWCWPARPRTSGGAPGQTPGQMFEHLEQVASVPFTFFL